MQISKKRKNFWWKKSYLLVYLKKVSIFAARIRENNNIKRRYSNEKNISTL